MTQQKSARQRFLLLRYQSRARGCKWKREGNEKSGGEQGLVTERQRERERERERERRPS